MTDPKPCPWYSDGQHRGCENAHGPRWGQPAPAPFPIPTPPTTAAAVTTPSSLPPRPTAGRAPCNPADATEATGPGLLKTEREPAAAAPLADGGADATAPSPAELLKADASSGAAAAPALPQGPEPLSEKVRGWAHQAREAGEDVAAAEWDWHADAIVALESGCTRLAAAESAAQRERERAEALLDDLRFIANWKPEATAAAMELNRERAARAVRAYEAAKGTR